MTYIKINGVQYPATIYGKMSDKDWDNRQSKTVHCEMDYATGINLWVDGAAWSIIDEQPTFVYDLDENGSYIFDENGNPIGHEEVVVTEYDNSEYSIAGPLTDNRDGTIDAKMGKLTDLEIALAMLLIQE